MKFVVVLLACVIAAVASPLVKEEEAAPFFNVSVDTRFLLFTRFNPTIAQRVIFNDMSTVANSNFDASRPTRFLIHGWQR
jgi:Lipase